MLEVVPMSPVESTKKPKIIKSEDFSTKRRNKVTQINQNDPTGFTVTIMDGKKHYKCNICSKVVVRRPQLHLLTHTSEKKFGCEECGQFFKSLKCLYGHRKVHQERVYWSWYEIIYGIVHKLHHALELRGFDVIP